MINQFLGFFNHKCMTVQALLHLRLPAGALPAHTLPFYLTTT
jgi:hypothetical protein